jgi:hypothetical protein
MNLHLHSGGSSHSDHHSSLCGGSDELLYSPTNNRCLFLSPALDASQRMRLGMALMGTSPQGTVVIDKETWDVNFFGTAKLG